MKGLLRLAPFLAILLAGCANLPGKFDEAATRRLQEAINAHTALQTDHLVLQVADGVAYLHGMVDTNRELMDAEAIAAKVPGIVRVVNMLAVNNTW